jgi:chromosome segregation protein
MSQAQVSLVFDNTGGELPIDFQEVVIGRRVSRNGASQYFINDAEVRLKDIIDFFSKIRLGTRGLTVIGQGAGDIFVRAHPQERMRMVQEILGLREYELKKYEAQRKLKHTHINLEKIGAMLDEVGPRLRMLKRQTAKWHKRSQIEEELQSIEKDFFVSKLSLLYREHEHIIRPLPELTQQHKKLQEEYTHLEKELIKFYEIIERACKDFAPQYIATYLIKLTGEFNSFYAKEKIIDKEDKTSPYKLFITEVFKETMQSGLWLLGIKTPEEM